MATLLTFLASFVVLLGICSCKSILDDGDDVQKSERELRHHLFKKYDKLVRPVMDPTKKISVDTAVTPLYLRDFDEMNQLMVLESWMTMSWTDDYLKWDPSLFGNITSLRIPSTEVWRPDFSLYTSPDQSNLFPVPLTNALIYNNGKVMWVPMFTIKSRCPVAKLYKKVVTCSIKIGSWTYSGPLVDIQLATEKVELSNFRDTNINWKLVGVSSERIEKYYPCCEEPYPSLVYNVTLKRRNEAERSTYTIVSETDSIDKSSDGAL